METISPLSKVTPAPDTYSTEISETRVSFQGFYDQNIYTTTPCAPGQRDFSFTINPLCLFNLISVVVCPRCIAQCMYLKSHRNCFCSVSAINFGSETIWLFLPIKMLGVKFVF